MSSIGLFTKKLIVFLILLILCDLIIGNILEQLYFSKRSLSSIDNKFNYILNESNEDILILGASSANHGYIPSMIEDSLGVTCYNAGCNGTNIYFYYTVLKSTLNRYVPRLVILDLTAWEFSKNKNDFDKLAEFYPFYYSNNFVKNMIDMSDRYEKYKMLSKTYRYNSKILFLLKQNFHPVLDKRKGYSPLYSKWDNEIITDTINIPAYDSVKFGFLKKFIAAAKNSECKVIIVASPAYRIYLNNQYSELQKYLKNKNVEFWNFKNDSIFINHREYFHDYVHLNNSGAVVFTQQIVERLKSEKWWKNN